MASLSIAGGCQESVTSFPTFNESLLTTIALDESLATEADSNWPGWRGHNASGISSCDRLPLEWNYRSGWRWRVDVAGRGNSSPVVWGESILLTSDVEGQLHVHCYSLLDGQAMWSSPVAEVSGATHIKNGHASASVVTDGQNVYAFFGSSGMHCLDLQSGKLLWSERLGELDHHWGTASSPVLYDDLVIQMCDNSHDSFVIALDKFNGSEVWRTARRSYGSWSTPVLVAIERGDRKSVELVINGTGSGNDLSSGGEVVGYDPLLGHELWNVRGTTPIACPTAIVHDGKIFSTSGRRGPIIAIEPGGFGEVTDSHVTWRLARGGPYVPTGVAIDGRLYLVTDNGTLSCYDTNSGANLWRERLAGSFTSSLVAGDGKIYATSEDGVVYVFAPGDEFKLLATNHMNERCLATPALAASNMLLRTESQLYCIGPLQLAAAKKAAGSATAVPAKTISTTAVSTKELPSTAHVEMP